jgi:hypothetical protein
MILGCRVRQERNLGPYPADRMEAWPISPRVNSPKNGDAEIVLPIETRIRGGTGEFPATVLMPSVEVD